MLNSKPLSSISNSSTPNTSNDGSEEVFQIGHYINYKIEKLVRTDIENNFKYSKLNFMNDCKELVHFYITHLLF